MSDSTLLTMQQMADLDTRLGQSEVAERGPDWGAVVGWQLLLSQLRGFWPLSSVDENADARDLSGQGRTLTDVGTVGYGLYADLVPYVVFDGATGYLARADEAGTSITGAHTYGCWMRAAAGVTGGLITKLGAAGQRSYEILLNAGAPRALVSSDGTAITTVTHTTSISNNVWYFIVARYTPSSRLSIFLDSVEVANTTSIPAAVFNSTADFRIGARGDGTAFLAADVALPFLCADDLPDSLIQRLYRATKLFFQ